MSTYQRMRRETPWKPQLQKGRDPLPLKTPQFAGSPGWILLSHNENGRPEALFVDQNEKATPLHIVLDERLFSDTVLRVTRLAADMFVVCDIRWLNGKNLFETLNYNDRRVKLFELLFMFHFPDLTALVLAEDVPENTPIRGWETYDDKPGSMGVFLPASE
jgi:hypothetical protein